MNKENREYIFVCHTNEDFEFYKRQDILEEEYEFLHGLQPIEYGDEHNIGERIRFYNKDLTKYIYFRVVAICTDCVILKKEKWYVRLLKQLKEEYQKIFRKKHVLIEDDCIFEEYDIENYYPGFFNNRRSFISYPFTSLKGKIKVGDNLILKNESNTKEIHYVIIYVDEYGFKIKRVK